MSSSEESVALLFVGGSEEVRRAVPSLLNTVDINESLSGLRVALPFIGGSGEVEGAVPSLALLVFCL
jgi:hypothetical protein